MLDPVVTSDGSTFSREGIEGWIDAQQKAGKAIVSPLTREVIGPNLVPNTMMRGEILEWVEQCRKDAKGGGGAGGASARST